MLNDILIVDDEETVRSVVGWQLQKLGFKSQTAANGAEAVSLTTMNEYLLVFMDVQMPSMDGLEATRAIRLLEKANNRAPVPIVGMTANPNREQCFTAGMSDFLFKPIMLDALRDVINRWSQSPSIA